MYVGGSKILKRKVQNENIFLLNKFFKQTN